MAIETQVIKKQLYTVKETAAILNTSTNVIYKLLGKGDLRAMKLPDNKIPDFEIERFKHWAFENEVDYSDILKRKGDTNAKEVQARNNVVGLGNILDRNL